MLKKNLFAILPQVLKRNESVTSKASDPPSSAILVVYLDKAEALPVSQISTRCAHVRAQSSALLPCVWLNRGRAVSTTCLTFHTVVAVASKPLHSTAVWMSVANFIQGC